MADAMRRVPWLRAEIWGDETFCGGRVHLGVLNPQPQPLVTKDKVTRVWFDGELYPNSTESCTPTAEEVCKLVGSSGNGLAEIDGVFSLACYDPKRRELVLANDRLGFRPLYYTETEDWFAYAAEVKAVLAIRDRLPDLDEISLRQFFGFDHMLGERTWWKGIELVPPASVWHISTKRRTEHQYWTFDDVRRDLRDEADVQVEFGRLWSQDVQRHSKPGTMPLLLSGGLDSRLMLAELLAQGADLRVITFGSEESAEMRPARRVAAIARVRHHPVYMNPENWWDCREEAVWQTDGLVNANHLHPAIAREEMHTGNWYSPMNIAGDLLFGGSHLKRDLMPIWRLSPSNLLAGRYMKNPFFDLEEVLSVSIADAARYMHGPSSDCFHLRQRYRRYVIYNPRCLAPYCETVFPGVRHEFLNLMLGSLSDEQRIGSHFYTRFLLKRHPKYYRVVPWQITGHGLDEPLTTRLWRDHIRWRLYRLVGKDVERRYVPSNQWFVNFPECVRKSKVREKFLHADLLADMFLSGAVKRALVKWESAPLSAEELIAILTFETYLRQVAGVPSLMTGQIWPSPHRLAAGMAISPSSRS